MVINNFKWLFKVGFSVILILIILLTPMKWFSTSADALESSYIISGNYYYIKNVNSGKYLTVSTDVANDGDNVYQYRYEGTARQR